MRELRQASGLPVRPRWTSHTGHPMATGSNYAQYQLVADRTLAILETRAALARKINLTYGKEYERQPHGPTLQVKRPPRYTIRTGDAAALQNVNEATVTITVQPVFGVDIPIGSSEMALILGNNMKDWDQRIGKAAASQIVTQFEQYVAALNSQFYNMEGVPGAPPATLAALAPALQRLDEEAIPWGERSLILGPVGKWALVPGLTGNFVRPVIESFEMEGGGAGINIPLLGLDLDMSQAAPNRTNGQYAGTITVGPLGLVGQVLQMTGFTANQVGAVAPGDCFTVAAVRAVNPQTRQSTTVLRRFVAQAAANADAGGNALVTIGNPVIGPIGGLTQQFQTVDSLPAIGAAVTFLGGTAGATLQENLVFDRDAILAVSLPQPNFPGAYYSETREYNGLAFRLWIDGDIRNNQGIMRFDVLAAFGPGNKEGLVRLTN